MMQEKTDFTEAQRVAAAALEAGAKLAKLATRWDDTRRGDKPSGAAMGALIGTPAAFWAGAAACVANSDADAVAPLAAASSYAAARLAVGDYEFVRESLIGQASWLSTLAHKMAVEADGERITERQAIKLKLALTAQRQAMQALATAAALNKLDAANSVMVDD